jgi:hypothetical protein
MPINIQFPPEEAIKSTSSSSRRQIGAHLRHKKDLSFRRDDVTQQRFGALYIDGKVVVDEENRDLASLFAGPGFQQEQFIDDAFIRAEPNGVAEESGDRAELAAVRTASSRFNRHNSECSPAFPEILEHGVHQFGNEIDEQWRHQYAHIALCRNKAIAKVAMARKLAVRLYWMWRRQWDYQQLKKFGSNVGQLELRHGVQ